MNRLMMALTASTFALPAVAGGVLDIDGFDTAFSARAFQGTSLILNSDLFPLTGGVVSDTQAGLGVVGGERRATFTLNPIYPAAGSFNDISDISGGELAVTTGDNFGSSLLLEYGFDNDLNLDLASIIGAVEGAIEFSADGDQDGPERPFDVTFSLTSGRGTGSESTVSFAQTVLEDGLYSIGLGNFAGLDLGDIDGISIEIDLSGQEAVDVRFDGFRFVPTPASAALLGLGGLTMTRRRR